FQAADLLAERRLRDVKNFCGPPEVELFRKGKERAQIADFDGHNLKLSKHVDQFIGHICRHLPMILRRISMAVPEHEGSGNESS
ncbi:MAG TPA: hypothetical protein VN151_12300, partial [Terracidiphilus sp.]|nr:hypothetical protein [Terracidiphilus sp.]